MWLLFEFYLSTDIDNIKMALNVFELSNYVVTSEFNQIVVNTLSQSQDESGLFKGGDSNDDLVSFRSTYDAVVLCESIN